MLPLSDCKGADTSFALSSARLLFLLVAPDPLAHTSETSVSERAGSYHRCLWRLLCCQCHCFHADSGAV